MTASPAKLSDDTWGIRLDHPLLVAAARRGVEVTTNVNLFLAEVRAAGLPVIGITGSKGKSTTSTLTYRTLREAGRPAVLAGNIGTPVLDVLEEVLATKSVSVLELSSYQCSDLVLGPSLAVLLALFPDDRVPDLPDHPFAGAEAAHDSRAGPAFRRLTRVRGPARRSLRGARPPAPRR